MGRASAVQGYGLGTVDLAIDTGSDLVTLISLYIRKYILAQAYICCIQIKCVGVSRLILYYLDLDSYIKREVWLHINNMLVSMCT